MLFNNKLFNSIACLLSFTNLQLVIPGRTWILLYLGRTVYKRLWACLALYRQPLQNYFQISQNGVLFLQRVSVMLLKPMAIRIILKWNLVYVLILLENSLVNSLTVPVKVKNSNKFVNRSFS